MDDVDAATSAFYGRDNSFGRSRSSLTGAAASELTACASVQGDSLSSPSSSLRDTTSLTQALLSRDAKTRILQEYEGLRGGFKREAAIAYSASSTNVSNNQASASIGRNGSNSIISRHTLLELEIERLEIDYARNELL